MGNPAQRGQDAFDKLRLNAFDRLSTSLNPPEADFGIASTGDLRI
jgi:hypothetical protein